METYYIITDGDTGETLNEVDTYRQAIIWALKNMNIGAYGINKVTDDNEYELTNVDELLKEPF